MSEALGLGADVPPIGNVENHSWHSQVG
jgi:hypothetical protein